MEKVVDQLDRDYRKADKMQRKLAAQHKTCHWCGEEIVGKYFVIDAKKGWYACNRCNNEKPGQ